MQETYFSKNNVHHRSNTSSKSLLLIFPNEDSSVSFFIFKGSSVVACNRMVRRNHLGNLSGYIRMSEMRVMRISWEIRGPVSAIVDIGN